jgi:hypothetical protein
VAAHEGLRDDLAVGVVGQLGAAVGARDHHDAVAGRIAEARVEVRDARRHDVYGHVADRAAVSRDLVERRRQGGAVLGGGMVDAVLARVVGVEVAGAALAHDAGEVAAVVVHEPRVSAERVLDRSEKAALVEPEVPAHPEGRDSRVARAASRAPAKRLRDEPPDRVVRLLEHARAAEMALRLAAERVAFEGDLGLAVANRRAVAARRPRERRVHAEGRLLRDRTTHHVERAVETHAVLFLGDDAAEVVAPEAQFRRRRNDALEPIALVVAERGLPILARLLRHKPAGVVLVRRAPARAVIGRRDARAVPLRPQHAAVEGASYVKV